MDEYIIVIKPSTCEHLVAWILFMTDGMKPRHESFVHFGLVERKFPQHDTGVITITPNEITSILTAGVAKTFSTDKLPAGNAVHHQNSEFIACVEKIGRLRIMREAHVIEA